MALPFTGERYVPDVEGEIRLEHLHRYAAACAYLRGMRVLDMACGEGYGCALMSQTAAQVVGVDLSEEAIAHARRTYGSIGNVEFSSGNATSLPLATASVDAVVSFETIEHHDQHEAMMGEFLRVLRPDGLLIMSSPNKAVYSDEANYANEFHVKELYFDELKALVQRYFKNAVYLGQRLVTGSAVYPLQAAPADAPGAVAAVYCDNGSQVQARVPALQSPMYFLLLASNAAQLPTPQSSLLLSEVSDLYLEFKKVARWASGVHGELTVAQQALTDNQTLLASERDVANAAQAAHAARQFELTAQLQAATSDLESAQAAARQAQQQAEAERLAQSAMQQQAVHADLAWRERLAELTAAFDRQSVALQAQQDSLLQAQALRDGRAASQLSSLQEELRKQQRQDALQQARLRTEFAQAQRESAAAHHVDIAHAQAEAAETAAEANRATAALQATQARHAELQAQQLQAQQQATAEQRVLQSRLASALSQLGLREQAHERALGAAYQALATAQALLLEQQQAASARHEEQKDQAHRQRLQDQFAAQTRLAEQRAQTEHEAQAQERQWRRQSVAQRLVLRRQQRQSAIQADDFARRDAAAAAAQAALGEELVLQHTLVVRLQQESSSAERGWELQRSVLQVQAQQSAAAAGRALSSLQSQRNDRAQLAAMLARRVLDASIWPGWRMSLPAYGRSLTTEWRELARETLLLQPEQGVEHFMLPTSGSGSTSHQVTNLQRIQRPAKNIDELLELDDQRFVQSAYLTLLGREADTEGQRHYVEALLEGESRLQVLWNLRQSEEGRGRPVQLPGFDRAMRGLRRSRMPVVGRIFRLDARPPPGLGLRRSIEDMAEQVLQTQGLVDERLNQLDQLLSKLRDEGHQQAQAQVMARAMACHQWPPETDLWRAALQFSQGGIDRFIGDVFGFALGRAPHGYELMHYREKLNQGGSRAMLLDKILQSSEFSNGHPPLVAPALKQAQASAEPAMPALSPMSVLPSLPIYAEPLVSVVIPVYGKLDYTLRCLKSIAANPPTVPFEVIVVDDCSPDTSLQVLAGVPGIRLVANDKNLGFIRSCNRGATLARGAFLCMLNNDTEVAPRWLDELVNTFEIFPGTGLVGSKLLFPDGKLQEAGGILWKDGSAWNFGRDQDPSLPGFNYVREVDYCSGASIMVPTELWKRLGGFDERYLPAYCEDSDMALKVRTAGLRVLYQPLSEVIHHEGVSSGTDVTQGVKAFQVINTSKLHERWKWHLATHQPNAVDVQRAKDRMSLRRVLVIDICTPTPNQDAGSVTVVNFMHLLREMRFQVTFVAEDNFLYMPDYTLPLQRSGIEVLYAPYTTSIEQHLQENGPRYDLVLMWRPTVVEKHLSTVRRMSPRAKVIYHTVDLHYLRMEREAELRPDASLARAAAEMKRRELGAIRSVDSAIVHSTHELEVLSEQITVDNVFVFPLIMNVPGSTVPWSARAGIAFVGGYQHPPNVDAVRWFVGEVMPRLRNRLPGVRLHLIGSKAPMSVQELACEDVVVEGFVEELQLLLDTLRLSVAPLRYGAGVKGKVGNSMAMGLPVVATSVAVEGMGLAHRREILIADGPQDLVEAIAELYKDDTLWNRLQLAGIESVEKQWGGDASYRTLQRLLGSIGLKVDEPLHPLRLYRDSRA